MKHRKQALAKSLLALLMCVTMLVSTTFAWFTDSVTSGINTIAAGNLDVELYHSNAAVTNEKVTANTELFMDLQGNPILWEPGVVSYENLRVVNEGDLALIYQLAINTANENYIIDNGARLSQALKVGVVKGGITATDRNAVISSVAAADWTTLSAFLRSGSLLADGEETWGVVIYWQPGDNDDYWNANNGRQLSSGDALSIDLGVNLTATQEMHENDSFGNDYDVNAKDDIFPSFGGGTASAPVDVVNGLTTSEVSIAIGDIIATIPAGVKVKDGTTALSLSVKTLAASGANIVLGEDEALRSLDVHVEGVADDNTAPITVTLPEVAPVALNMGNYKLYHVENGTTNEMTLLASTTDFSAHNQFKYDPATGDIVLHMATFSEVALVADTENAWEGKFDYTWYDASKTEYVIANADQLAGFGAIVGGMNGKTQDSFAGKTVKLIADINLGDAEAENNPDLIFYPIGYYNSEGTYERTNTAITSGLCNFCGTFDGNGHTIANFYHNTWEMKGDNNYYDATLQYYRDGMGLFGRVYGGTVKNLTVSNFSSDGEYTTTGVIAAYADGATFENIAITNCNPRVYNIGNGGIVGCVGWYAKEGGLETTFKNITVDNSNKISALWGSYDVACGGIVGQYYPTSGQSSANYPVNGGISFENCHVSAQMDVYNDVCANYQYYAYRYTGMLIGSVRENETIDGHVYPKMDDITAEGCTVNFGSWNNYYYCELVANSLASYTHDHQFSRLEQVQSVDATKMEIIKLDGSTAKIPTSGRVNYVVVTGDHATENAECFHFVDGKVHNHKDYNGDGVEDKETVNGESVYVEDNYHIYLPFGSLFTGYGWGVTSLGLSNYEGVTTDVEIATGNYENSDVKFESIGDKAFSETQSVSIGSIFQASGKGIIKNSQVQVFVSPADDNSTVTAIYAPNTNDWTTGTLTFNGTGKAIVTIQDYYFCTPTTITVEVTARKATEKFESKFKGDFLYRVGNANPVKLDSLFQGLSNDIGTVSVTIEKVKGEASGTYTSNATWTNGTIQFNGTGVVKVSITDDYYCTPTVLTLEVVDAYNAISALSAPYTYKDQAYNVVLLNDIDNGFTVSGEYGVYGNGFTVKLNPNSHSTRKGNGYAGYIHMNGGTIDNVRIEGPVFAQSNIYQSQGMPSGTTNADTTVNYFRNAICIDGGDAKITNSYISGARTAVLVKAGGNVVIENSRISGGAYANIEVLAATSLTLNNVVTEQKAVKDSYNNNKDVVGLGIAINSADTKLFLNGLTQYNWINQKQWESMLGDYASQFPELFGNSYTKIQYTYNSTKVVNAGIIWACDVSTETPNVDGSIAGYGYHHVSLGSKNGFVYTSTHTGSAPSITQDVFAAPDYAPKTQGAVPPKATFDYTTKNNEPEQSGFNDYCYYNSNEQKFMISFEEGKSKAWSFDILTVKKGNTTIEYNVTVDGGALNNSNKTITFSKAGDYTVTYTYTDSLNYDNSLESYSVVHTKYVHITVFVVEPQADPTTFAFGDNGYKQVSAGGLTYVMPNVTATKAPTTSSSVVTDSGIGSKTIDGETIYYPIIGMHKVGSSFSYYNYFSVFEAVTINDANGTNTYDIGTATLPDRLTVIGGFIDNGAESANGTAIFNYSTGKTIKTKTVSVKGSTVGLCYYPDSSFSSSTTARPEQTIVVKYCYTDTNGKAYYYYIGYWCAQGKNGVESSSSSSGCLAEGTMITLADGTQKPIEQITYEDELLAWDFNTGSYAVTVPSLIEAHEKDAYRIINLKFADGTTVKVVVDHGFFDVAENNFVFVDENNVDSYVGHEFVKMGANGTYESVELIGYDITVEEVTYYSIQTAIYNNSIADGMFTLPAPPEMLDNDEWFNYFEIGEGMKYDEAKMQADIEKYGLYEYSDFAEYVTYEQFLAFNGPYLKVLVGKGYITYDEIIELISIYVNP